MKGLGVAISEMKMCCINYSSVAIINEWLKKYNREPRYRNTYANIIPDRVNHN